MAQHVIPPYILIKMAYVDYFVNISPSFKTFRQKLHLLVFALIFTFNVRLVPDKNFRTIAPTVFLVGVSTN